MVLVFEDEEVGKLLGEETNLPSRHFCVQEAAEEVDSHLNLRIHDFYFFSDELSTRKEAGILTRSLDSDSNTM